MSNSFSLGIMITYNKHISELSSDRFIANLIKLESIVDPDIPTIILLWIVDFPDELFDLKIFFILRNFCQSVHCSQLKLKHHCF